MLRPSMNEIIGPHESAYEFVVKVAKMARTIAVQAEEEGVVLEEKPVKMAVEELARGNGHLVH